MVGSFLPNAYLVKQFTALSSNPSRSLPGRHCTDRKRPKDPGTPLCRRTHKTCEKIRDSALEAFIAYPSTRSCPWSRKRIIRWRLLCGLPRPLSAFNKTDTPKRLVSPTISALCSSPLLPSRATKSAFEPVRRPTSTLHDLPSSQLRQGLPRASSQVSAPPTSLRVCHHARTGGQIFDEI
jgi:hypothetical protein